MVRENAEYARVCSFRSSRNSETRARVLRICMFRAFLRKSSVKRWILGVTEDRQCPASPAPRAGVFKRPWLSLRAAAPHSNEMPNVLAALRERIERSARSQPPASKARFPQSWGRCCDVRPAPSPAGCSCPRPDPPESSHSAPNSSKSPILGTPPWGGV